MSYYTANMVRMFFYLAVFLFALSTALLWTPTLKAWLFMVMICFMFEFMFNAYCQMKLIRYRERLVRARASID